MIDTIVIDFGTSRTKAAYYNPQSQQPTLIRLGEREYVSSVFYVEKGGNILFGDSAQAVLENQKVGSRNDSKPIRGLKLELSEMHTRRGERYSAVDLLTPLFTYIRERAANLEGFDKAYPTKVILTTTKWYRPSDTEALRGAAQNAGFEHITVIAEPESVAKGWVTATQPDRTDVIVLDCGGGTVDWTYLHRENRNFRVMPTLEGNAAKIGGHDVDEALARILDLQLERDSRLLNKISDIKEMFCEGIDIEELPPISIGSRSVKLDGGQIEQAILEAFINPVCKVIESFIEKVKKATRRGNPAILLVGGSAKLHGLKDVLKGKFKCGVNPAWHNAEYAPVLGAVPIPASSQAPEVSISSSGEASEERLDRQLIGHFREVATLIGERQDSEIEFVVDEEAHRVMPGLNMSRTHVEKLRGRADRLDRGSLRLTVLGGVSTGKSTLINTMIGQGVLPTGEGACTSVPIEIVHGSNGDRATIVERGGKSRSIPFEEFKETYCFTDKEQPKVKSRPVRPERFEGVEYVQLESESTLCKKGIRFVDTLGVNADELSDDITSRFIAETDTILVVMGKDLLPETTCTFIREFAKAKAVPGVSGYEHVFFVLQNPGTWDQYEDTGDRKQAEASLRGQLEGLHFDENLYDSRVFIVNSRQAFFARTTQKYRHKLEESGILELEEALFKFMESTDRVVVVTESAVNRAFIPVLDEARRYISGKQEFLDKDAAELEQRLRETRKGLGELKETVKECQSIAREFVADIQDKIIRKYTYSVEDELSDEDFKDYWEERELEDYLEAEKLTAETLLESESESYIKDRFSSVIKRVSTQYPLGTMVQDALTPRAVEFFDTLGRISPYQKSAAGILDGAKRFEIQIEDAFSDSFDMPSISLIVQEKHWYNRFIFRNPAKRAQKDILRQLDDAREALTEDEVIKHIERSINEQVSDVTNTLVTRLNSEIEAVERQLNDAYNMAGDTVVEKERLKKIAFLLTAKYEEISRAVFGRVLNLEELRARVAQSRQAEADA